MKGDPSKLVGRPNPAKPCPAPLPGDTLYFPAHLADHILESNALDPEETMPIVNRELFKGNAQTIVLKILSRGEMYGYQIAQEAEKLSNGSFTA